MDEAPEILNLGEGKYSFLVGRHRYTLTTPLDEERFVRIVTTIQDLVNTLPPTLTQDERLFLALMSMSHQFEDMRSRIGSLIDKISDGKAEN